MSKNWFVPYTSDIFSIFSVWGQKYPTPNIGLIPTPMSHTARSTRVQQRQQRLPVERLGDSTHNTQGVECKW